MAANGDGAIVVNASPALPEITSTPPPTLMVRYEFAAALVKNLPKARDLVDIAAGTAAGSEVTGPPLIPAVAACAVGRYFGWRRHAGANTLRCVGAWLYEPEGWPKLKHHWQREEAGFVEVGSELVAKCPLGMSLRDAQALLDVSVPYFPPRWSRPYPQRLYAVNAGVVYRATPTNPGVSYHGFPEHPRLFPANGNAIRVKRLLLSEAERQGCVQEVRRWMGW